VPDTELDLPWHCDAICELCLANEESSCRGLQVLVEEALAGCLSGYRMKVCEILRNGQHSTMTFM
jgi:hypothetical protein